MFTLKIVMQSRTAPPPAAGCISWAQHRVILCQTSSLSSKHSIQSGCATVHSEMHEEEEEEEEEESTPSLQRA